MPWTHQGKIIREGRGWVDANGVKHPTYTFAAFAEMPFKYANAR